MSPQRSFALAFKVVFTSLIVFLVIKVVGWSNFSSAVRQANWYWLPALFGATLVNRLIEAVQMRVLLSKVGVNIGVSRVFLANSLSAFYSLVLPGDVVASAAKWANLSAATGERSIILNAIIYNRIALLSPTLVIGIVALLVDNPFHHSSILFWLFPVTFAVVAGWLMLFHPLFGRYGDVVFYEFFRILPAIISGKAENVLKALSRFRVFGFRDHGIIYLYSLLALLPTIGILFCATRAFDVSLPFLTLFWVNAILLAARQVPITISNLGVREGILIAVLSTYGVEPERSVAIGLTLFCGHIFIAFIGLVYQISLSFGLARWKNP